MPYRSGLDIKKRLISRLKQKKEVSLRELESSVDTNYRSVLKHCQELEYFGFVQIREHKVNKSNGRPYKTASLTSAGAKLN